MKKNILQLSLVFFLFVIALVSCQEDDLDHKLILQAELVTINDPGIYESLKAFRAYEFKNMGDIEFKETMNLEVRFGNDYQWKLYIAENVDLTESLYSYITTGEESSEAKTNRRHYQGELAENNKSSVRVSFYSNKMAGLIFDGEQSYQIMHLNIVSDLDNYPNVMIVCKSSDIIEKDVVY